MFYVQIDWETLVGGKPKVNLTLSQKKEVEPETIPSPLLIFESAATWIALMVSGLAVTQFSSIISMSIVEYISWLFQHQS